MKYFLAWLCLALTLTVQTGAAQDLADNLDYPVERELTAEVPADGIDEILLDGHDGKTTIEVGTSDVIKLRVTIETKRKGLFSRSHKGRAYVEEAEIETKVRRGRLAVALSSGIGRKDSEETWAIVVPQRLAVVVKMDAAHIDITDVEGGVDVKLGVGKVQVDVPHGRIEVGVQVGDADVTTATDSFGDVYLRAQVGNTRLWIGGHRIRYSNPPGPGSRVSIEGEGRDRIKVMVQVGDAELRVG